MENNTYCSNIVLKTTNLPQEATLLAMSFTLT